LAVPESASVSVAVVARVQSASIEDLDLWFDRALVAEALDAVFMR
jgi:hypothetical protein